MDLMSRLPQEQETAIVHTNLSAQPILSGALTRLRAVAVVWMGVLFGVHTLFSALLLLGYKQPNPKDQAIFTDWGRELYHPERDIPLYILFCGFTFCLCSLMMFLWNRRYAAVPLSQKFSFAFDNISANLALALAATFLNPLWFFTAKRLARLLLPHWKLGELVMILPVLAEAVLFLLLLQRTPFRQAWAMLRLKRFAEATTENDAELASPDANAEVASQRFAWNWRDAGLLLLIWLFVYTPRTDILAGFTFQSEHFHHWDYFVTAPALGYLHGQALNTQVYSQYGVGFPLLFALLNPIYSLSYGHLFQFANVYTCFYICGGYLFLRLLLRSPLWAAFGAFALVFYKLFNWTTVWFPPYQLPSNTVLRGPFDIWFLIALLAHQQSRRPAWLYLAGALTGLSLLFETDTGIYITFTFGVYSALHLLRERREQSPVSIPKSQHLAQLGGAWLLFGGVFLSGMALASRGAIMQPAFWRGWIECFTAYPGGISMMPVAEHVEGLYYGMIMTTVYLFALCYHFNRLFDRRIDLKAGLEEVSREHSGNGSKASLQTSLQENSPFRPDLALLCVALYGTCSMLHFMGRSHPSNLYVSFMAFILLCITGLHTLSHYTINLWREHITVGQVRRFAWGALCLYGVFVWWREPHIRAYPNFFRLLYKRAEPREISLYVDDNGRKMDPHTGINPRFVEHNDTTPISLYPGSGVTLPSSVLPKLQQYAPVIEKARQLEAHGKKIAILANDETWLYLASGATPWYRYSPLYPNIITKAQIEKVKSALLAGHVDYVFIEAGPPFTTYVAQHPLALFTTDTWRDLRQFTAQHYKFEQTAGIYEVWRR